jgi:hypothetical protein
MLSVSPPFVEQTRDTPDAGQTTNRWFSVGQSVCADTREAATEACRTAMDHKNAGPTQLAIVFAAIAHCTDELLQTVRELIPGAEVIGCSSSGEISVSANGGEEVSANSSVLIALLGGYDIQVRVQSASMHDPARLREEAARAAEAVQPEISAAHRVVLALTDGLSVSDQCEVVRGVYEAVGASIPLVGGCAGDGLAMTRTAQMYGDQVLEQSLVLTSIGSNSSIGVGVAHGWRGVGEPMFATAVDGTSVLELDGRPAVDVYLERLGADPSVGSSADAFSSFALTHPLALVRRRGDEIRWVAGADLERRSLKCNVEFQRNAQVWLTEGDCASTIDAVGVACDQAIGQLNGAKPIGAIAFNCAARRAVLGDDGAQLEVAEIAKHLGGIPVAGLYTYGEFARVRGPNGFHNQTLVMLVFS